jgi:hypothetical protein
MQTRVKTNKEDIGRCGCGRSPTGKCIGWHGLTEDEYRIKLAEHDAKQLGDKNEVAKKDSI